MTKLNISLPETMKSFVEEQAAKCGFSTVSEYMRALIRQAQMRAAREGSESNPLGELESGCVGVIQEEAQSRQQASQVSETIAALAMTGNPPPVPRDSWRQTIGLFDDDPAFARILDAGHKIRESEYDER
jgi:antitoxin ParD1/3/4